MNVLRLQLVRLIGIVCGMAKPPAVLALDAGTTDQDRTPPGGAARALLVHLGPAQHAALLDLAEDEGETPATLVRRAVRLMLAQGVAS